MEPDPLLATLRFLLLMATPVLLMAFLLVTCALLFVDNDPCDGEPDRAAFCVGEPE